MIRTTLVPDSVKVMFPIPQEYVGRELEIIAFPIEKDSTIHTLSPARKVTFTNFGIDATAYKFDREEANAR